MIVNIHLCIVLALEHLPICAISFGLGIERDLRVTESYSEKKMRVRLGLVIVTRMSTVKQSWTEMQEACKTFAISPKCSRPCCCGLPQNSQQLRTVKTVNFCRRGLG